MTFVLGALGFGGYEALRIYRKIIVGRVAFPKRAATPYLVVILVIALFAGTVSWAINPPQLAYCLYIGFSVPSSIEAILKTQSSAKASGAGGDTVEVDDVEVEVMPSRAGVPPSRSWLRQYFS